MKRFFKYFLVAVLTIGFVGNVNALLSKEDIDFENKVLKYNESTGTFDVVDTSSNLTIMYTDVQIADSESYDTLISAYNAYKDNPSETTLTAFSTQLTQNSDFAETDWSSTMPDTSSYVAGSTYVRWAKATNNETSTSTYSFGIIKVAGTTTDYSDTTTGSETNPDTGISPLYLIPVMAIFGSVLVFKKRRYE